jgi:hypothetical protein
VIKKINDLYAMQKRCISIHLFPEAAWLNIEKIAGDLNRRLLTNSEVILVRQVSNLRDIHSEGTII